MNPNPAHSNGYCPQPHHHLRGMNRIRRGPRGRSRDSDTRVSEQPQPQPQVEQPCTDFDMAYFHSYAHVGIHEEMIKDRVRTETYRAAIMQHQSFIAGKVVVDVGCGTGILSIFCAQAGAKRVYAVDASDIAVQANEVVKANNLSDTIIVLHGRVEDVQIDEEVDVIISEWMGYMLLYESMLGSVITARDRWLKPGGLILPSHATLFIAPITHADRYSENIDFWRNVYGIDKTRSIEYNRPFNIYLCPEILNGVVKSIAYTLFRFYAHLLDSRQDKTVGGDRYPRRVSAMLPLAKQCAFEEPCVETIVGENVLTWPHVVKHVDCHKISLHELETVTTNYKFKSMMRAPLHGFAFWFDVEFNGPAIALTNNHAPSQLPNNHTVEGQQRRKRANPSDALVLSTAPEDPPTHWQQTVLYFYDPIEVEQDQVIEGSVTLSQSKENRRFMNIHLEYASGGRSFVKESVMR